MAVTLSADALATATGADTTAAARYLAVVSAQVDRYAPGAPEETANEAAIRFAGWLHGQPQSSVSAMAAGPLTASYMRSHLSGFRHSGAMALLSPWKVRRAGVIA